ncbi:hypothetical protein FRX31_014439 [Thalictrum thalictroides]|uniref:Uncharacterized protein n=1 Tax=Thalictrum thalictroides TaxID=46969 RepID=A0A7J6WGE7_THATH|nr:hypothetical protein FRX31_014439 [Thalictrum thalictroides]
MPSLGILQVDQPWRPADLMVRTKECLPCVRFFNQMEEEKLQCAEEHVLAPIRYGASFNPSVYKVLFWRDFLRVWMHPQFHSPSTPGSRSLPVSTHPAHSQN